MEYKQTAVGLHSLHYSKINPLPFSSLKLKTAAHNWGGEHRNTLRVHSSLPASLIRSSAFLFLQPEGGHPVLTCRTPQKRGWSVVCTHADSLVPVICHKTWQGKGKLTTMRATSASGWIYGKMSPRSIRTQIVSPWNPKLKKSKQIMTGSTFVK